MLRDTPAIRYNLASALFDLRRYPEAARLVASVLANQDAPEEVRRGAEVLQQQIDAQAATLAIRVEGEREGVSVHVDAEAIPDAQLRRCRSRPAPASSGECAI